jgi:hypothetical protein
MRTELVLWWIAILAGIGVYYVWYLAPAASGTAGAHGGNGLTVTLVNFQFQPKVITVPAGSTVRWVNTQGVHTVDFDQDFFKSSILHSGGIFRHTFNRARRLSLPLRLSWRSRWHRDGGSNRCQISVFKWEERAEASGPALRLIAGRRGEHNGHREHGDNRGLTRSGCYLYPIPPIGNCRGCESMGDLAYGDLHGD